MFFCSVGERRLTAFLLLLWSLWSGCIYLAVTVKRGRDRRYTETQQTWDHPALCTHTTCPPCVDVKQHKTSPSSLFSALSAEISISGQHSAEAVKERRLAGGFLRNGTNLKVRTQTFAEAGKKYEKPIIMNSSWSL